ncbi:MAG: DUF3168 domain-containing protein [Flavobacteriales bacterium]|nr:DUF3168 domain-containing protein [Flavobacteriales bacterium]
MSAIVSDRIYPQRISQNDKLPAITYSYVDNLPINDKDGVSKLDTITIDVDIWADGGSDTGTGSPYRDMVDLANKVRTALDRFSGTNSGVVIDSIRFDGQQELYENEINVYHTSQQYTIREKV